MAVLSAREILPRSYSHKLGGSPEASCVYVATLDGPTEAQLVLDYIAIQFGSPHPEFEYLTCNNIDLDETDRFHATVTYSYSLPSPDDPQDPDQPPWSQPDKWTFSTSNASVACTYWYKGDGNADKRSLTNTAGDLIFGLSKAEAELRITISGSRLELDLKRLRQLVNTINKAEWAGFPKHTVQCVGMSASPDRLVFEEEVVEFWNINIELVYRSSSHNLTLPNVGWNVIVNGKKERAWTYITEDGARKKVPAPHPVPLNLQGGFLCGPEQDKESNPDGGTDYEDDGTDYYG